MKDAKTERRPVTTAHIISEQLTNLLGRHVVAKPGAVTTWKTPYVVAAYTDHLGTVVAACIYSPPVAASLGAALTMIPIDRAKEVAKSATFEGLIYDNFHEVCNIMVCFFEEATKATLTLLDVQTVRATASPGVESLLKDATHRTDVEISVEGYLAGSMTLLTA